jgi:hypothetical protein
MLMMASLLSPGQASFGKLWEYLVATFTLRLAATAALPRNARSLSLSFATANAREKKLSSIPVMNTAATNACILACYSLD